ncbi:MAG: cation transporter, partial [Clostridia bacterium]|nr:cation transporter [Clostridia bacterium]
MERTYSLKGLDCPNCAAKIETEVGALPGVTRSAVNLMKQTLKVTAEGDGEELTEAVARIVKKHEPEIEVLLMTGRASEADPGHSHEHGHEHDHEHEHGHEHGHDHGDEDGEEGSNVLRLLRLIAAGLVFLAGVILPRFAEIPEWARFAFFAASWLIAGYDVVIGAVRGIFRGEFFDERFLMTVSTVGAFAIGEWPEAAAVMVLYQLGELFQ